MAAMLKDWMTMKVTSTIRTRKLIPSTWSSHEPLVGGRLEVSDVRHDKIVDLPAQARVRILENLAEMLAGANLRSGHPNLKFLQILNRDRTARSMLKKTI